MTLLVRDEEDIVETQIAHHLALGVDVVIATDHRSTDATPEILRSFERRGVLHVIREDGEFLDQSGWVTRMARLAAVEHGADWVINTDADEFWIPRAGTFRELFAVVPTRVGIVRGFMRHFVPRPEDGAPFHERMVYRRRPVDDHRNPFAPHVKVAHRGRPDVEVGTGNHDATAPGLRLARDWYPLEILHFPIRTAAQMARKYTQAWVAETPYETSIGRSHHIDAAYRDLHTAGADVLFASYVVDDRALSAGLADRSLVRDTRLADLLSGRRVVVAPPAVADDVDLLEELQVMVSRDAVWAVRGRLAELERAVGAIEDGRSIPSPRGGDGQRASLRG